MHCGGSCGPSEWPPKSRGLWRGRNKTPAGSWVADIAAAKTIYKVGGPYHKTKWYGVFAGGAGTGRNLFNEVDYYKHGQHRHLTSASYSEKWVALVEPYIAANVQLALQRIAEDMKAKSYADVFRWFMFMVGVMTIAPCS